MAQMLIGYLSNELARETYTVAEHAVALMLALNRKTHRAFNRVRDGNFSLNGLMGFDIHGRTTGVVGAGKIGFCAVRILHGFGCRVLAYDRTPKQDLIDLGGVEFVKLDTLLKKTDIITLYASLFPATFHMIDSKAIAKMKPGVMIINTSRGALIDTEALIQGIKSGKIGSAGLDVYEEETDYFFEDRSDRVIPDDTLARLLTYSNVIVTGHQGFFTRDALGNIAQTTLNNIHEYEEGKSGKQLYTGIV
jgi:D-lactate dehydrogenase